MTPKDFVEKYYPYAKAVQDKTGLSAIALLSQSAWESGWGEKAVGNNFFGEKDTDGVNGNEQLITTTEYSRNPNLKFPVIISKILDPVKKLYKYTIKDYFKKFNTPEDSFMEHAEFFQKNPRYKTAWMFRSDYSLFFPEIQKAGYATDPNYSANLIKVAKTIINNIPKK